MRGREAGFLGHVGRDLGLILIARRKGGVAVGVAHGMGFGEFLLALVIPSGVGERRPAFGGLGLTHGQIGLRSREIGLGQFKTGRLQIDRSARHRKIGLGLGHQGFEDVRVDAGYELVVSSPRC